MTSKVSTTRRYLAVFLPWLSAERAMKANAASRDKPFALVTTSAGTMRIVAVSPTAARELVGLTLADARAREPNLFVAESDPVADKALLEWFADVCDCYSPSVATALPSSIVIDISGSTTFACEAGLTADVVARFAHQGVTAIPAVATTAAAALALARFGPEQSIESLPIAALYTDEATECALRRAGLMTIGMLAKRPRAPLAARFGEHVVTLLARVLGEEDVPLTPRRYSPEIVAEHRFVDPVAVTLAVLTTLDKLMRKTAQMLADRNHGGRRFEATLFRSDGHIDRLTVDTAMPTRDAVVIARLFEERISALVDPLDPGFGYDLIRLTASFTEVLAKEQIAFDSNIVATQPVTALIDQLCTRLGPERVRRSNRGNSHIPERAAFDLPNNLSVTSSWPLPAVGDPPLHPLHLFNPPESIEVLAEVPDGPPRWFRWRRLRHDVARAEGPERIAPEWWRRRSGGATRDYYRVEDSEGRRFWVFRHDLYGVEKQHPDWYLHGLFA